MGELEVVPGTLAEVLEMPVGAERLRCRHLHSG
jgi:hypothetical protein